MFSSVGKEDTLKVEILRCLDVAALRQLLEHLYDIPEASQRLQRTPDVGGQRLRSSTPLAELVHQPIFLMPADVDEDDTVEYGSDFRDHGEGEIRADEEEQAAMARGMMESLRGVTYQVNIILPEGIASASASRTLSLDALARVGDVQVMLEVEMTGCVGKVPLMMVFNGKALPPEVPLHFAGIRDQSSLSMVLITPEMMRSLGVPGHAIDEVDSEDDDPVLNWAARR
jgi:hypothetical protein